MREPSYGFRKMLFGQLLKIDDKVAIPQLLKFLAERFYNNPRPFYGFESQGVVWARMISAAANVLGRMYHLMDIFEDQVSGERREAFHRGIAGYLNLYYADREKLPADETNGNTPIVSAHEVAWYAWTATKDPRMGEFISKGEVKNNIRARRGEAEILACSSYALRRLKRTVEAKDRIDRAFRLLRETKDYPASRINPGSEPDVALRALADHHAGTGQPERAAEVYRELLEKILASNPDPRNDLPNATILSRTYEGLSAALRRNRQPDKAKEISALRLELWRHWQSKLPNNSFVRVSGTVPPEDLVAVARSLAPHPPGTIVTAPDLTSDGTA